MTRPRKTLVALAVLAAVVLALNYLAAAFINLESVKRKIQRAVSQRAGAAIEYESIDLSIFPRTHADIHRAGISIPGRVRGTAETLTIYPKIWPLFAGKLLVDELRIQSPDIAVMMSSHMETGSGAEESQDADKIKDTVKAAFASLAAEAPEMAAQIKDGRLTLTRGGETVFLFDEIQSELVFPLEDFSLNVSSTSNIWKGMWMSADFNAGDSRIEGEIELVKFNPDSISEYFPPSARWRLGKSVVDVNVRFHTDALTNLEGELESSLLDLAVYRDDKSLVVKGRNLKSAFHIDTEMTAVSLSRLDLDHPRLSVAGELRIDRKSPRISLKLEGQQVDVQSIREAVLGFAGDIPEARTIFSIVKGGVIRGITFDSKSTTAAELGNPGNFIITGRLDEGNIFVPGPELNLENVYGDVVIAEGVLNGKNLAARLENAAGRAGVLRMGVTGRDAPFHLALTVKADLAELLPLLKRLIRHDTFVQEVSRFYNVRGTAEGRLVLGEHLKAIEARVDISDMNISADYQRIPYTVAVTGGQFHYDRSSVSVKNVKGKVGKSSFSDMTASVELGKDPHGEILSGRASLVLEQIYPWLSSYEKLKSDLEEFQGVSGTLNLSTVKLKGPLLKPQDWVFQGAGDVHSLGVSTSVVPEPVSVASGTFELNQDRLSITDNHVRVMDATFRVSGDFDRYREGLHEADMALSGRLGPKAAEWLFNISNLPPDLNVRTPISVSQAHLAWKRDMSTSLQGSFALPTGPEVVVDLTLQPGKLAVDNLAVQDDESRASLVLVLKDNEWNVNFDGNLTGGTVNNIFVNSQLEQEWLKGNFEARIVKDAPMQSSARGILEGKNLIFPWNPKMPLTVKSIVLDASGDHVQVKSGSFALGESFFETTGDVSFAPGAFLVDMNVSTAGVDGETIKKAFESERKAERRDTFWDLPVQGNLDITAGAISYDRYTWEPFHADIAFSQRKIHVAVTDASLCGISFPGTLDMTPRDLSLDFRPAAADKELEPAVACLFTIQRYMTGKADLVGNLRSAGMSGEIVNSLKGDLEFSAREGRIYQHTLLAKILTFLNMTEVFRGRMPDLAGEGFAYKTIRAQADIQGGIMDLKELIIDGSSMGIAGEGSMDFMEKKVDLKVLVAPLKTADFVIKNVPIIKDILGGTLVSIPVRVTGDLSDPVITYLSPSDIGSGLLGIMKNALQAPVRIIQPVIPVRKETE